MRTLIVAIASSAAVIAVAGAFAADVSPGLWEFTMETRVPSEPGFAPAPFQMTQCLSAQDAREPGRLLGRAPPAARATCPVNPRATAMVLSYENCGFPERTMRATAEKVTVFWQPGRTSCLRTKKFPNVA